MTVSAIFLGRSVGLASSYVFYGDIGHQTCTYSMACDEFKLQAEMEHLGKFINFLLSCYNQLPELNFIHFARRLKNYDNVTFFAKKGYCLSIFLPKNDQN